MIFDLQSKPRQDVTHCQTKTLKSESNKHSNYKICSLFRLYIGSGLIAFENYMYLGDFKTLLGRLTPVLQFFFTFNKYKTRSSRLGPLCLDIIGSVSNRGR